jgi:hypothetical protein
MIDYIDSNFLKIQETHTLLDKIEQRVKSFIREDPQQNERRRKSSNDLNNQYTVYVNNKDLPLDHSQNRHSILLEIQEMD